jgi:hypothetical protein
MFFKKNLDTGRTKEMNKTSLEMQRNFQEVSATINFL